MAGGVVARMGGCALVVVEMMMTRQEGWVG